jgi:membrane protein YdbS with pleckstrin-like domain
MSKLLDLIEQNAIKQSRFSNTSNTMSSSSSSSSGGISFTGALTVLFVGLKLTNVITWSWWWVLSPIWISLSLAVVVIAIAVIIAIIAESFK